MEQKCLAARTPGSESSLLEPSKACYNCQRLKKHCDTTQPSCARCKRLGAACMYNDLIQRDVQRTRHLLYSDPIADSVSYTPDYPIESRVHIPMLIRFFQDKLGLLPFDVEAYSLAYYLRSSWISYAMNDPCLMHATLLSASAQFDTLTGAKQPSYATLYHQSNTLALVRSRLADLHSANDATVASVLLLAMHSSDNNLAHMHFRGLLQLISARGGLGQLGYDGFLAQIINGFLAILFDQVDPFPIPEWQTSPLPHTLISLMLVGATKSPNQHLRHRLLTLFQNITQLLQEGYTETDPETQYQPTAENPRLRYALDKFSSETDPALLNAATQPPNLSKKEHALLRTCMISGQILAYLLDDALPWSEETLDGLVAQLSDASSKTERATWVKHCPEANGWVLVMGAAMVDDVAARAGFLMRENCIASSMRDTRPSRYVAAWYYYRWLKRRRLVRGAGVGALLGGYLGCEG
ncbi:hypothetical protein BJY00DRAFT_317500 [Aspergillus carlsbadensis]|nr:hypothetical protein BJY00DRAFT_317500 [Aspergillus carlsbadensis]